VRRLKAELRAKLALAFYRVVRHESSFFTFAQAEFLLSGFIYSRCCSPGGGRFPSLAVEEEMDKGHKHADRFWLRACIGSVLRTAKEEKNVVFSGRLDSPKFEDVLPAIGWESVIKKQSDDCFSGQIRDTPVLERFAHRFHRSVATIASHCSLPCEGTTVELGIMITEEVLRPILH
jgi:hypothetical protein